MRGLVEIHKLGYMIRSISQTSLRQWYVAFYSPYEWETWSAEGESLARAARNAATIARRRGPAYEASQAYRSRVAARFVKERKKVARRRKRIRL